VFAQGNCYRRDELSRSRLAEFTQIEGFMVDRTGVVTWRI